MNHPTREIGEFERHEIFKTMESAPKDPNIFVLVSCHMSKLPIWACWRKNNRTYATGWNRIDPEKDFEMLPLYADYCWRPKFWILAFRANGEIFEPERILPDDDWNGNRGEDI